MVPAETGLYLATVGVLREYGVTDASMQVHCMHCVDPDGFLLEVAGRARPVLAQRLGQELRRDFPIQVKAWRLSREEAHDLIDRYAIV
jgi:hypothetical protein